MKYYRNNLNNLKLAPLGKSTFVIQSVIKQISKKGNNMYVITLVDDLQQFLPVRDYMVFYDNNGTKNFYPKTQKKINTLLKKCCVDSIEKLAGRHINACISFNQFRGRQVEYYY